MKTKITVLSVIIVLSMFFLSIIVGLKHMHAVGEGAMNMKDTTMAEASVSARDAGVMTGCTVDRQIQSFAYEENIIDPLTKAAFENGTAVPSAAAASDTSMQAAAAQDDAAQTKIVSLSLDKESGKEAAKQQEAKAKYSDIGIATASSYVNIRKSASTDGEVLGKLYKDAAAKILKTKGGWYLVESGSVKGYVKSDYLKTGLSDKELKKYGTLSIVVKVDGLNVREKADTESDKVDVIYKDETYPVIKQLDDWVKVNITDDKVTGYIKSEYADIIIDFKDAVSKEEEEEIRELKAQASAKKEAAKKAKEIQIKQGDGLSYTDEELKLLACLIHAEAGGQSYEGKLAVANIVLNRVKSGKFSNTIKSVIYSPGQFSVASSGSLAKQLSNYNNYCTNSQLLSIKAAKAALKGSNNVGKRLYFNSYKSAVRNGYDDEPNCVKIDDQLYW